MSASKDTTLKVWNIKTKKLMFDLPGHADEVLEPFLNYQLTPNPRFTLWTGVRMVIRLFQGVKTAC